MSNAPMPSYNPAWSGQPAAVLPQRPRQIQWAFFLILAAAVFQVISTAFTVVYMSSEAFRDSVAAEIAKQNVPETGQDLVGMSVGIALATGVVMAVVAVIVYVAIAFLVKSGRGWARIVGAVLAAISITHLFAMTMPAGIFTVLQVASGIVAIIFCFIAPGSKYFTDMKNFRLANKMH
ncbi:hypothetical protein [Arthrobacter sp. GMC3]|uniref:hypothetical protein n=1 Tax=Arthrobacter sp. GMC3 TaxID=2058894 RepID=UPI000CE33A95|nr:hypothetical protein [Arthrobacter sp. GMC3]